MFFCIGLFLRSEQLLKNVFFGINQFNFFEKNQDFKSFQNGYFLHRLQQFSEN